MKNLGEIKDCDIDVKIISNKNIEFNFKDFDRTLPNDLMEIRNYVYDVSIFDSPFELSKKYIDYFEKDLRSAGSNDIFVYLEHDQLFTQANLDYFKMHVEFLDKNNLRPGYVRIEWSSNRKKWYSTDSNHLLDDCSDKLKYLQLNTDLVFLTLPNPYFGFSVHSMKSALRFFQSHSKFTELGNGNDWGITERSAMTDLLDTSSSLVANELQFTSIAPIAFDRARKQIVPGALAWHLSNRYANTSFVFRKLRRFGNLSLDDLNEYLNKNILR